MCHNITSLPGFYKTKKVLQHGAYLPSAQVISAFSFFVSFLVNLLREQKAATDQFLRTAWYATIIKSLPGFYRKKTRLLGRWLPQRLSKRQSPSTTTVLFRTTFIRTIKLNLLLKWLLGSNLSQLNKKGSATGCVPSSSSGDFCFFVFRFSFGVSSTRTKSKERSISQNCLICHLIKSQYLGFTRQKRFCNKLRTFVQLRWFLFFPFSFFFWSFF